MAQHLNTPEGVTARIRENIRLLKLSKRLTDTDLARAGGFTSRQVVAHRLAGRTPLTTDDLARIAIALKVDPAALWMETSEMYQWLETHGDEYKAPKAKRRARRRTAVTRAAQA